MKARFPAIPLRSTSPVSARSMMRLSTLSSSSLHSAATVAFTSPAVQGFPKLAPISSAGTPANAAVEWLTCRGSFPIARNPVPTAASPGCHATRL